MLPVREAIDYPVINIVSHCDVCKVTGQIMMPDAVKGLTEIKGDDMDIHCTDICHSIGEER